MSKKNYKTILHEIIDSLDDFAAKKIYYLVMGALGRKI